MAELYLDTRDEQGIAYLTLKGDFDADNAPRVQESLAALTDRDQPVVFVHMADLKYIDSAGLGVLVGALKQAGARAGQIILIQPSPFVARILRVTALDKVFLVFADEAQARAALRVKPAAFSS